MEQVFEKLKDKLTAPEFLALEKAVENYKKDSASYYKVCLECRKDIEKAREIVEELRRSSCSLSSLFEYVASVKTLYLTDRNLKQTKECAYDKKGDEDLIKKTLWTVTANAHIVMKITNETDGFTLCKAVKFFNDLKFFANEVGQDKSVYQNFLSLVENKLSSITLPLSLSLCPLYLSLYPLEKAEELVENFNKIFASIKKSKNIGEVVFFSEKGLETYGYSDKCEEIREWAIKQYLEGDERFSSSIMSEIIINN